jgi:hypothetical protein
MKIWKEVEKEKKGAVPDKTWVTDGESLALLTIPTKKLRLGKQKRNS